MLFDLVHKYQVHTLRTLVKSPTKFGLAGAASPSAGDAVAGVVDVLVLVLVDGVDDDAGEDELVAPLPRPPPRPPRSFKRRINQKKKNGEKKKG